MSLYAPMLVVPWLDACCTTTIEPARTPVVNPSTICAQGVPTHSAGVPLYEPLPLRLCTLYIHCAQNTAGVFHQCAIALYTAVHWFSFFSQEYNIGAVSFAQCSIRIYIVSPSLNIICIHFLPSRTLLSMLIITTKMVTVIIHIY